MVAWSLAKTPFHECHVVEMGDPGQFFLPNVFGEMKLPQASWAIVTHFTRQETTFAGKRDWQSLAAGTMPCSRDTNCLWRVRGDCTPDFSSFVGVSICWHSVSGQQPPGAGAALWGSRGHSASIPTNKGDLGQGRSLSRCQLYQTGTDWLDSVFFP